MFINRSWLIFLAKAALLGLITALFIIWLMPQPISPTHQLDLTASSNHNLNSARSEGPFSYANAVNNAAPSVVNIHTTKIITQRINPLFDDPAFRRFFGNSFAPRKRLESSLGSGVLVTPQGHILTNNHVIEGADEILIALRDGRTLQAKIVGSDPESDLAVLKVTDDKLPSITLGNSSNIRIGDVTLAIGNPFGVGQTVTMGIISATGRSELGINTFENFIQTDAAINPGNSGGALINAHGHLIGINTAIFSRSGGSQGIGFAIPIDIAKTIMEQIVERGYAVRGWFGIDAQDITPALAESFGLKPGSGVLVAGVLRRGPAGKAGMRPGDVITHIAGKATTDSKTTMDLITQALPEKRVQVVVVRNGKKLKLDVMVAQRPIPKQN